jgi:hypothetical protein
MLGKLIKGMVGLRVVDQEHEIPAWMGALLDGDDLLKGAGHKYIRRIPKAGGGYRYFYNVTGGQGLGHHAEMVQGAAFKVKHAGKEGHFHITADHGEEVTVRHDESGHEQKMSKAALRAMLHAEHAEALGAVKARAAKTLEQAKKTGTAKQQEKAAALVSKYGGDVEPKAKPKGPKKQENKGARLPAAFEMMMLEWQEDVERADDGDTWAFVGDEEMPDTEVEKYTRNMVKWATDPRTDEQGTERLWLPDDISLEDVRGAWSFLNWKSNAIDYQLQDRYTSLDAEQRANLRQDMKTLGKVMEIFSNKEKEILQKQKTKTP